MKVEKKGKSTVFTVEKPSKKKKPNKQENPPVKNKQEIENQEVD